MMAVTFLRRNPSAGLLVVQLPGILLYPLMETRMTAAARRERRQAGGTAPAACARATSG